ncbi:MAG: Radical SAM domain protein [Firmicutes bacterium]|nr:Radical SAM domain protein [Bacillota bacterium]
MITYELGNNLYINLTNRCTNKCSFCVKEYSDGIGGQNLWIESEPTAEEIIKEIGDPSRYKEVVFCGFGEPVLRLEQILEVSRHLKKNYRSRIRINTNGQGNLVYGRNIVPLFEGLIDVISVSLNAKNAEDYQRLCKSSYGEEAFYGVIEFIKECKQYIPEVVVTVVDVIPPEDIEMCRTIAGELGVGFKVRHFYNV